MAKRGEKQEAGRILYVVDRFEPPSIWRHVLSTYDKKEASDLKKALGKNGRVTEMPARRK